MYKVSFPSASSALNAPVLIQSAEIPLTAKSFAIISPSTNAPIFHVLPPSEDIAHPAELSLITTFASSNFGVSQKYRILLPSSCFTVMGNSPLDPCICCVRFSKAFVNSVFCDNKFFRNPLYTLVISLYLLADSLVGVSAPQINSCNAYAVYVIAVNIVRCFLPFKSITNPISPGSIDGSDWLFIVIGRKLSPLSFFPINSETVPPFPF